MRGATPALCVALAASACGKTATYENGVYDGRRVQFRHGALPDGWAPTKVDGLAVAFYHAAFGATAGVAPICEGVPDSSLESLAQQELIGLEERRILEENRVAVDGREAVEWVVAGSIDGVEMRVNLVVFRKGPCVYDLNLVSSPEGFERARPEFKAFVAGFQVLEQ